MPVEPSFVRLLLAGLALGCCGVAFAEAGKDKIVCVPNSSGSGWDCGSGADAPAPRPVTAPANAVREEASRPPVLLIDPDRLPRVVEEAMREGVEPGPAPLSVPPPAPAEASVQPTAPRPAAEMPATPVATTPAASPASAEAVASLEPPAVAAPVAEPTPEPAPAPAAAETTEIADAPDPAAEVRELDSSLLEVPTRDGEAFLALAASRYTLQLSAARSREGFDGFLARTGLDRSRAYVFPVQRDGQQWWLLCWSDFSDLETARAALGALPAAARAASPFPRRVAPLQAEIRQP